MFVFQTKEKEKAELFYQYYTITSTIFEETKSIYQGYLPGATICETSTSILLSPVPTHKIFMNYSQLFYVLS